MTLIRLTVYGEPAPQGSKRHVGNGVMVESSKKVGPWRRAVATAALPITSSNWTPVDEPVEVTVTFFVPRPRSVRRTLPTVPPDLDKLCRSLGDALSIDCDLLADDSLICRWDATKVYADVRAPGAEIEIRRLELIPMAITE